MAVLVLSTANIVGFFGGSPRMAKVTSNYGTINKMFVEGRFPRTDNRSLGCP